MTRRFGALMEGGFPYFVAVLDGRVVGYAYAGAYRPRPAYRFTVENSVYLEPAIHRRGIGLQLMQRLIAESRGARLPADDRGDRRFRQRRIDRRAHQMRVPDDRHPPQCRLQIRPLARHRDDAARPRRGRRARCRRSSVRRLGRRSVSGPVSDASVRRSPQSRYTTASLRSITSSTRSSSWPRRRIRPLAEITLYMPCLRASRGSFSMR